MHTKRNDSLSSEMPTEKDINQKRSVEVSPEDTNQQRKVGMFQPSSDFDVIDKINPFLQGESNPCGGRK